MTSTSDASPTPLGASPPGEAEDVGQVLLSNQDGTVRHVPPFVLVFDCPSDVVDDIVQHGSRFAFAVGGTVTLLGTAALIPKPLLLIGLFWLLGGAVARRINARHRQRHGQTVVDFDRNTVRHRPGGRRERSEAYWATSDDGLRSFSIGESVRYRVEEGDDEDVLPRWLLLEVGGDKSLRLARAPKAEMYRIITFFRKYGLRCAEGAPGGES